MTISAMDKAFVLQVYKKYQSEYNLQLPKINDIRIVHTDEFWSRFNG